MLSKLEPPPLPPTYTLRERVGRLIEPGAHESCQLTLVSAPPGYGKTVAVRGWLARQEHPFAWLGLDEGDGDTARLVRYLIGALQTARPRIGERTATLLGISGAPSAEIVAATLLDEVAEATAPFVLVLDDYHTLPPGPGRNLVDRLIMQAPPFVQLVLLTRQDPDVPLARLRANGRLVELRAEGLRYSPQEAQALMTALGVELDAASVELLTERTEGWAAGLQLAALTLRGRAGDRDAIAAFDATDRYLIDYLADEVMASLPADLRSFLERTSVAERLCPDLAQALTDRADAGPMLREVMRRNLFLLPSGAGSWCRYHHLFADYLRSRLGHEDRASLELRAAAWCSTHGMPIDAARYASASGRWPAALPFVADGSHALLASGEPSAVLRSTDAVPGATLWSSADLLADRAWAAFFTGAMPVVTEAAERLAELEQEGSVRGPAAGRAHAIRAWLAVLAGHPEDGERLARLALETLDADPSIRSLALLALGDACWDLGKLDENAAAVAETLAIARRQAPTASTYLAAYVYAVACNEQGRRREAERVCREMVDGARDARGRMSPATGLLRAALGMLAYEANDLATAALELETGFELSRRLGTERLLGGESRRARAMTRLATIGPDAAAQAVRETLDAAAEFLPRTRQPAAEALAARVALRSGDRNAALDWAQAVLDDPCRADVGTPKVRLHRDLAAAAILIEVGRASQAETIAAEAGRTALKLGSVLGQIQASIVIAAAAELAGRRGQARSRLASAVTLAAPGGYVRRFVEDARSVAHLLPTVRSGAEAFVDAVIDALEAEAVRLAPGRSPAGPAWRAGDGAVLELLTERELDVLRLLSRGRSNAAIGESLGMSTGTAKWHVANVLSKLGASNRTQAATRAHELGLA